MSANPGARLVSLDAFRGLTVAAMILVNNPGSWAHIYWPLDHARWHGWTPTDLIFPFFLFIVGVALNFSRRSTFAEVLRRALIIVGLGLFMAAFPFFNLETLRFPGVLQRIGVCYLAAWLVRRAAPGWRGQALGTAVLLALYWFLMTEVPVPGGGAPNLEPDTNLGAYVDRFVLGPAHMWKQSKTWDPEGLLSTIPAVATTLLGSLAGIWLCGERTPWQKALGLLSGGAVLTVAGLIWHDTFPINKNLWTSSYVLFTGGLAAYFLGLCYWLADVRGYRAWARPAVIYGVNAIALFVASGLVAKVLGLIKLPGPDGVPIALQAHLYRLFFASWAQPINASLAYAVANVVFWFAVLAVLDRRGIHIKV